MKTVMIFTGAEYLEIGTEYFFQHEVISNLKLDGLTKLYFTTKIATKSIQDLKTAVADGKVKIEGTERFTTEYVEQMKDGISILEIMLKDLAGDKEGLKIINRPIRSIIKEIYSEENK